MNALYAIGNFIHDALTKDCIAVKGDGLAVRSYMDQEDLAIWLWRLLHDGKAGEAYNVGSDQAISIRDLAYLVRDILAPNKEVLIEGSSSYQRNRYVPSIQKARAQYQLGLKKGLKEAIQNIAH